MTGGLLVLGLGSILAVFAAACGGNSREPLSDKPVSARVVVKVMGISAEGVRVESTLSSPTTGKS